MKGVILGVGFQSDLSHSASIARRYKLFVDRRSYRRLDVRVSSPLFLSLAFVARMPAPTSVLMNAADVAVLLRLAADSGVQVMAAAGADLSDNQLSAIAAAVDSARRRRAGLPPPEPSVAAAGTGVVDEGVNAGEIGIAVDTNVVPDAVHAEPVDTAGDFANAGEDVTDGDPHAEDIGDDAASLAPTASEGVGPADVGVGSEPPDSYMFADIDVEAALEEIFPAVAPNVSAALAAGAPLWSGASAAAGGRPTPGLLPLRPLATTSSPHPSPPPWVASAVGR